MVTQGATLLGFPRLFFHRLALMFRFAFVITGVANTVSPTVFKHENICLVFLQYLDDLLLYETVPFSVLIFHPGENELQFELSLIREGHKQRIIYRKNGDPCWIRTSDNLLRRQVLYPTELRDLFR